jgi:hypothetical protein
VGGGFSALGVVAALLAPERQRTDEATATAQPGLVLSGEPA